jgi:hypothetical protein
VATGGRALSRGVRGISLRQWAVIGIAVATVGLVGMLAIPYRGLTVVGATLVLVGSLCFVTVVIAGVMRQELRRQARIVQAAVERGMIDVLPPRRALELLLDRVYGPSKHNDDVITGLLGGEGRSYEGGDLTISEYTEIDFRLLRADAFNYRLVMEARYSFRTRVAASTVVIFATSDPVLRDSIVAGCRLPLFELWFVEDDPVSPFFEESVEAMRDTVMLGVQYVDDRGHRHDVPPLHPSRHQLRNVSVKDWGRYLTFFAADRGQRAIDRDSSMHKLRIFELDLAVLATAGTTLSTVESLTIRSTTLQLFENRFCYWEAPYPCFVQRMNFDVTDLGWEDEDLQFRLKPFSFHSEAISVGWSAAPAIRELPVESWLLPGHGVALMWRGADRRV